MSHRGWAAEAFALVARVIETGADAFSQDLAFKLGEYGEQSGHRAASGRGQVECFRQGYETDSEMLKFL